MQKNSITNKITPCCSLPFSVIYWWIKNLTLNSEADREYLISQLNQNGTLSISGWKVLINSGTLESDSSFSKEEALSWFDCNKQPSCEQLKLIIEGLVLGSWTPETEIPSNVALIDAQINGINYTGNVYTKEQTDAEIEAGLLGATDGWTMQTEEVPNGTDKVVKKITGYTGGTGTLPQALADTVGKYFAAAGGFTSDVNLATNFKGAAGSVPISQTLGTSTTTAISQKAATDELMAIKLPLSEKTIPTTVGYIATPAVGATVDYTVNSATYQMRTITYDVVAGDEFIISGRGIAGSNRSLWMLIDATNKVIVKETDDATIKDKTIKATQAGKLVVNTYMVSSGGVAIDYYVIKSFSVFKNKLDKSSVTQVTGQSILDVLSQKAVTDLVTPLIGKSNTNSRETTLLQHLNNPTIKTKIKFFGDSTTHGLGATGFSATGTDIPTIPVKRDLLTSPSYVNLFRNWINDHFNKEIAISPMYSSFVTRNGIWSEYAEGLLYTPNNSTIPTFSTPFNGTKITVGFWKNSTNGIFDIYIDGIFNQSVDTYAASPDEKGFVEVTVADGNHILEIRTTNNKNASSSGKMLVFTYLKMRKTVEVINNGVTGYQSHAISILMRNTTENDDDYVFMMAGLNDRGTNVGAWRTGAAARYIKGWLATNRPNAKMILMSPNPVGPGQMADTIYNFQPEDIDMALRKAALDSDIPFISNYTALSKFIKNRELPSTKILIDELHPNDFGYKMIFENILYETGLSPRTAI